jgi:hypothetical protein
MSISSSIINGIFQQNKTRGPRLPERNHQSRAPETAFKTGAQEERDAKSITRDVGGNGYEKPGGRQAQPCELRLSGTVLAGKEAAGGLTVLAIATSITQQPLS